jgi:hypothetical protein
MKFEPPIFTNEIMHIVKIIRARTDHKKHMRV